MNAVKNKILSFLHKDFTGVNQAAILLAIFAFLSQILGLVRDKMLAHFLGPSSLLDVYYSAFRVPDFLYVLVASVASVTIHLPFLLEKTREDREKGTQTTQTFINEMFTFFLMLMVVSSLIAFVLMPFLAKFIVPGFDTAERASFIMMSRIMLLSPILLGLSNLFGSITQLYKKFVVYALSPVFYNIGILVGILVFYPLWGIYGLAGGVVLGAFLHLLIQIPVLIKNNIRPRFVRYLNSAEIKKVSLISLPRTIALSLNSLALIVIVSIASTLKEGSISIFNLSFNLQSVPLGIIGVSYSVAAFPTLARVYNENKDEFVEHVVLASRQIIFWSMPIIAIFVVLRAQIVRVILGSGMFSWSDTRLTAAALALFSLSIIAQSLIMLIVRGYYSAGNTRTPLIVNFLSSLSIIVFAHLFVWLFKQSFFIQSFTASLLRVEDVSGTTLLMLPLAYSIGTLINGIVLWRLFKKDFMNKTHITFSKTLIQSVVASFAMGCASYIVLQILAPLVDLNTFRGVFLQGFSAGILGIVLFICVLKMMKSEELEEILVAVKRKIWKTEVVAPAQGDL